MDTETNTALATAVQSDIIIVEQLPIISEKLESLGPEINQRIKYVMSLDCSEDNVKEIKEIRSVLNKEFNAFESVRKKVKGDIMAPLEVFERDYKKYVTDKYRSADAHLKGKIESVEDSLKQDKSDKLKAYFDEYCQAIDIDFVSFGKEWRPNVTLTASLKSLKTEAKAFVDNISASQKLISTLDHADEILIDYRRTLDATQSIAIINEKYRALEALEKEKEERAKREEVQQAAVDKVKAVAPEAFRPVAKTAITEEPTYKLSFTVWASKTKLKELQNFLNNGGYKYE